MTGARDLLRRLLWWRRSPMPPYQPGPDERMATVTPARYVRLRPGEPLLEATERLIYDPDWEDR